jgi:hypothetical protein
MRNNCKICVVGWYFFKQFYSQLKEIKDNVFVVAHRQNKILDKYKMNYFVTDNIGLEFGAYNWYIKNKWDKKSNVLFMHDDMGIKNVDIFLKIFKKCSGIDQSYITGGKGLGYNGRCIYMSKAMIKIFLKDKGGIWYDKENDGFIDDIDHRFNIGIETYHRNVVSFSKKYKKLKIGWFIKNDGIFLYRRGKEKIPNLKKIEKSNKPMRKSFLDTKKTKKSFEQFLKNKKVVIVSSAPYMIGSNYGSIINSYDIVVRLNQGYCISKKLEKDIGSRTDILYTSFNENSLIELYDNSREVLNKLKWVCCISPHIWKRVRKWQKNINKNKIPVHMVTADRRSLLISELKLQPGKETPTTGMMAIFDILKYDIKELYFIGFTFYQKVPEDNGFFYYSEYNNLPEKPGEYSKINKSHLPDVEFQYFKKLCKNDERIKCDNVFKDILKIY